MLFLLCFILQKIIIIYRVYDTRYLIYCSHLLEYLWRRKFPKYLTRPTGPRNKSSDFCARFVVSVIDICGCIIHTHPCNENIHRLWSIFRYYWFLRVICFYLHGLVLERHKLNYNRKAGSHWYVVSVDEWEEINMFTMTIYILFFGIVIRRIRARDKCHLLSKNYVIVQSHCL